MSAPVDLCAGCREWIPVGSYLGAPPGAVTVEPFGSWHARCLQAVMLHAADAFGRVVLEDFHVERLAEFCDRLDAMRGEPHGERAAHVALISETYELRGFIGDVVGRPVRSLQEAGAS